MNEFEHGLQVENENASIIFGNKLFDPTSIIDQGSVEDIHYCQQIHSNKMVQAHSGQTPEADAHYSGLFDQALAIKTADCLPVMISSPTQMFALHAGWRGLESCIIANLKNFTIDNMKAYIGPHIHQMSYEVSTDVANKIVAGCPQLSRDLILEPNTHQSGKYFVNLQAIAIAQLIDVGIELKNIFASHIDTLTNEKWNSYRRDGSASGRNISLIFRKP